MFHCSAGKLSVAELLPLSAKSTTVGYSSATNKPEHSSEHWWNIGGTFPGTFDELSCLIFYFRA